MEMFLNGKEVVVIKCDVAAENLQFVGNVLCVAISWSGL